MRVSIQLKHILVLLKSNGPLKSIRIQSLLSLTPVKAEIASTRADGLIALALKLGIIKKVDSLYLINFVVQDENPSILTPEEKEKLINLILTNKKLTNELKPLYIEGRFKYDSQNLLHKLLAELKILDKNEHGYYFAKTLKEDKGQYVWKYDDDKQQKEIGKFAERLIYNQEYEKLSKRPEFLAGLVHVSKDNDTLGYDIKSYDLDKKHELYIEVKGTSNTEPYFIITANELEVAKRLHKQYKIIIVCGINLEERKYAKIIEITDPDKNLKTNYRIIPQTFRISPK